MILVPPLYRDRTLRHQRHRRAECCEGWQQQYADHAGSDGEFHDAFAFFVLDDNAADVAFFDKLLDLLDNLIAVNTKFFGTVLFARGYSLLFIPANRVNQFNWEEHHRLL